MGNDESKSKKEEALSGIQYMKEAVASRNAFFAAVTVYGVCLKNVGAAFTDGAQGESSHLPSLKMISEPLKDEKFELETEEFTARASVDNPQQEDSRIFSESETSTEDEQLTRKTSSSSGFRGSNAQQEAWAVDLIRKAMRWESSWLDPEEKKMKTKPLLPTVMENEESNSEIQDLKEVRWKIDMIDPQAMEPPTCMHKISPLDCVLCMLDSDLDSEVEFAINRESGSNRRDETMPQKSTWDYFFLPQDSVKKPPVLMPPAMKKRGGDFWKKRKIRQPESLEQLFLDLDDHFLKSFESTLEVSQLLESNCSDFAHDQPNGHQIDHSKRAVHLITRDQPFQGKDNFDTEEAESLAAVLNKMLACEMNLYDQIKAGEVLKYEYHEKVSMLNKQKKKGKNTKKLGKLEVAISDLHTRCTVKQQSVASAVAEINHVRDEQLYPKLSQLVDGMEKMWKAMLFHHESQFNIVYFLKSLENFRVLMETSECHYECTIQLYGAVCDWYTQFCGIIEYQTNFIRALHSWLKLSLIRFQTNPTENVNSPPRVEYAPIHSLVIAWKNDLDYLPDEVAKDAIRKFAAVIQTIVHRQDKGLKTREQVENVHSNNEQFRDCEELNSRDAHLASLGHSLPELFRAMSEMAQACSLIYHNLRNIVNQQARDYTEKNSSV